MSNERTDEFLSWRGRLDQPDALPEQGLDNHEASWQRLAERIREKPRRLTGYWVAAACLLLALIPAIRFLHPRSPATALRQRALVQKVAAKPLPVVNPVTPPPVTPRTELPLRTSLGLLRHGLSRSYPSGISAAPSRVLSPAITVADIKPATDSHQLTGIPRAELPLLVSDARASSPKKQLKVVYYNEISNPSGPSPSTAARIPGFLKLSMGRFGSPVAGGDQETQPNNDPVLTIKLIPKNN